MNLFFKLNWLFLFLGLSLPVLADLPTPYSADKIEGKVEMVAKLVVWGKPCTVIHFTGATGFEREAAKSLFGIIRRSGYEPNRKSLRNDEVVLVLPDEQAKTFAPGDWIQVTEYLILAHDNRTLASEGKAKQVTKIDKPNRVPGSD